MLPILSIVYLAVLAGCAAAVLLTAIMFLVKKKAGKSLALYAVCVMALLGLGFLVSVYNPMPNPRYTEPEPVVVSPGSQYPPIPWAIDPKPAPAETVPVDSADEPVPEPAPIADVVEAVPPESPARAISAPSRISRSTAAPTPVSATAREQETAASTPVSAATQEQEPAAVPAAIQAQAPAPDPAPATLSANEPLLGAEPEYAPMSNPELADGPELADMSNPELWDDGVRLSADS